MRTLEAMQGARHDQSTIAAASYPPLHKTQGRATRLAGQEMCMFRHHDVTDHDKMIAAAHLFEHHSSVEASGHEYGCHGISFAVCDERTGVEAGGAHASKIAKRGAAFFVEIQRWAGPPILQ